LTSRIHEYRTECGTKSGAKDCAKCGTKCMPKCIPKSCTKCIPKSYTISGANLETRSKLQITHVIRLLQYSRIYNIRP
jgi:hypothetical protein